jgi:saccharopine dehydrogenase-like NADP-dependent oxidoreductase
MSEIVVLGSGMVGSAMAKDLSKKHSVTVADIDELALNRIREGHGLQTIQLDVTDVSELSNAIGDKDLVVSAVPGFLGFQTLRTIIAGGKDVVDISFFPEDALELHALAVDKGVTAIVDCGVAPGMGNIILGRYNEVMEIDSFSCMVGGLPKTRTWPFQYKAPFSPIDVIEEYTRPARYVEHGELVVRDPLTDVELFDFDHVGTLEAFNSDGLRSLLTTMDHIPNMKEKTLRYPGHAEYISVLKASGFFDTEPREVNGNMVRPIDVTNTLLFDAWKLGEEEAEFTVMRIDISGKDSNGNRKTVRYDLYDEYDSATKTSSMARTTGYTATAASELILQQKFNDSGVFPPEHIGKKETCFDHVMDYLKQRNVIYRCVETVE